MNKQLELVQEFQTVFQQSILNKEDEISVERRKLRLALLFEELTELAEAYGLEKTFAMMCHDHYYSNTIFESDDTNKLNKKEVLDATCDLQYILFGTILENGQQNEFDEAFQDVHDSNISKLCKGTGEALGTIDHYAKQGIETYSKPMGGIFYGVYRTLDNKVLKNINYKPVDLNKYV